ncbi:MAG TPA: hypothetical protein VKF41_04835 [Bryobacteraceae bacterium]|nr:hypothetical protein [Bryobacteraceae bacterium]
MAGRRAARAGPAEKPVVRAAPLLDRIRWDWLALAFSLLLLAWLVTGGDWDFFPKASFLESFYDAQAQSLLHGRIDVPPDAIGTEAFMRNGKAYGYFGPTPALMRLPMELLLPGMYGRWGAVSMLLASALTLVMLLLLMQKLESRFPLAGGPRLRNLLRAVLILGVAIGSTNFFVSAERKVYQESIIWGSAWAFAAAVFLACYLMRPAAKWLALGCAAALLAFLARVSSAAGPLVALVLLVLLGFRALPRRAAVAVGVTLVAAAALWAGLNYWKFGQVFTSQPIALNLQYNQQRVQRVKGDLASVYNLPITLPAYLGPDHIKFAGTFPWIFPVVPDPALASHFPKAHFDTMEPLASAPAAMPELFLGAIAGLVLLLARRKELRELRAPMCGAMAGCALIFVWGYIAYRNLHDMFPWLVLGSAVAVVYLPAIPGARLRHGLAGLFAAATLYAMCANFAMAIRWQRYASYPVPPQKRAAFTDLGYLIDNEGLSGFLWYARHWSLYIPAASFQSGNLLIDRTRLAERGDQPVVVSQGQAQNEAEYAVELPAAGTYQMAVLYASAEPRPVHFFVNGLDVKEVCGLATGGWGPSNRAWSSAGVFQLSGGANRIGLTSRGPFPAIEMIRIFRLE